MRMNWKKQKKRRKLFQKHNLTNWKQYKDYLKDRCFIYIVRHKIKEASVYLKRITNVIYPSPPYFYNKEHLDLFLSTFASNVCPFVPNEYMKVPDNYIPYVIPIKPEVDE